MTSGLAHEYTMRCQCVPVAAALIFPAVLSCCPAVLCCCAVRPHLSLLCCCVRRRPSGAAGRPGPRQAQVGLNRLLRVRKVCCVVSANAWRFSVLGKFGWLVFSSAVVLSIYTRCTVHTHVLPGCLVADLCWHLGWPTLTSPSRPGPARPRPQTAANANVHGHECPPHRSRTVWL